MSAITPPPRDKLEDTHIWRDWFNQVAVSSRAVNNIPQYPADPFAWTAAAKGSMYFNTTTNKLKVAGAAAWETITSV